MPICEQQTDALMSSPKVKPDTLPTSNPAPKFDSESLLRLSSAWATKAAQTLGIKLI